MNVAYKDIIRLGFIAGSFACSITIAYADTVNWIGPDNGRWGTAANWSTGIVPSSGDDVSLSGSQIVLFDVASSTIKSLTLSPDGNLETALRLLEADYSLNISGDLRVMGGDQSGLTLTGSNVVTSVQGTVYIGEEAHTSTGTGIRVREGATFNVAKGQTTTINVALGADGGLGVNGASSNASLDILLLGLDNALGTVHVGDGGTLTTGVTNMGIGTGEGYVEVYNGATWATDGSITSGVDGLGTITLKGGGTLRFDEGSSLILAQNVGSTGYLYIGSDIHAGTAAAGNIVGGSITMGAGDAAILFSHNDADYKLDQVLSGNGKIHNQSGQTTLMADSTATAEFHVSGGTLIVGGAYSADKGAKVTAGTLQIGDGNTGGSITGDINVDVGAAVVFNRSDSTQYVGTLTGGGIINQSGGGSLTLTGDSKDFLGTSNVAQGTLNVNGSLGGAVQVASGASLGGTGTIKGDTTVNDGGSIVGVVGRKLDFDGNLVLNANSQINVAFSNADGGDLFDVTGAITLAGIVNVSSFGDSGPGMYHLFRYGSHSGNNLSIGSLPSGVDTTQTYFYDDENNREISLVNANGAVLNFWNGPNPVAGQLTGGSGIWNTADNNWTQDQNFVFHGQWAEDHFAVFGGTAGKVQVDNSAGRIYAAGMQFLVSDYEIASLTSDDVLTLTEDPATGEKPIIRVGSGHDTDATRVATISAVLAGTDGMQKTFSGTLILTGENTYSGNTDVKGGTLQIGDGGTSGSILGDVSVDQAAQLTFSRNDDITFEGAISGEGGVAQKGGGNLTFIGANSFSGDLNVASGTVTAGNDGTVFGSGNINIASNSALKISDHVVDINGLSGTGTLDLGTGKLSVDLSEDAIFSGELTGDGSLIKTGAAALILSGTSDYSGDTTISAGVLRQGAEGAFSHSSAYMVAGNALLDLGGFDTAVSSLTNNGTVQFSSEAVGTTLTVSGNYSSDNGVLQINTVLGGDDSKTDRMIIQGDSSGTTNVKLVNREGEGAQTGNGIQIIAVEGQNSGVFKLVSDYVTKSGESAVVAGAYAYTLQNGGSKTGKDGNWYLVSGLSNKPVDPDNPGQPTDPDTPGGQPAYGANVPVYQGYRDNMHSLMRLATLQQRVGSRFERSEAPRIDGYKSAPSLDYIWGRIDGTHSQLRAKSSTGMKQDINTLILQSGIDGLFYDGDNGKVFAGLFGSYGTANGNVVSQFGDGEINTKAWSLGGAVTWYSANDFYVDAQAQATWFDNELFSDTAHRSLADDQKHQGYAFSIEAGQKISLDGNWTITPQSQLSWSSLDAGAFTDIWGSKVDLERDSRLLGRIGLSIDYDSKWQTADGRNARSTAYLITNFYKEFEASRNIRVSGTKLKSENQSNWMEVGSGIDVSWADEKYAIYGQGSVSTALEDASSNYMLKGNVGFKFRW